MTNSFQKPPIAHIFRRVAESITAVKNCRCLKLDLMAGEKDGRGQRSECLGVVPVVDSWLENEGGLGSAKVGNVKIMVSTYWFKVSGGNVNPLFGEKQQQGVYHHPDLGREGEEAEDFWWRHGSE